MSGTLSGKTAVVLGGSSAHGSAVSRELGRMGANMALGGRDRGRLEALAREVETLGGGAIVVGTHLAKARHPEHLVRAAVEAFGGLDFLLFMAHSAAPPLGSIDVGAWERSLDVNLKGVVYCLAAALPATRESEGGRVVVLGVEEPPGASDPLLRACRVAVRTILEEVPREFSPRGIHAAEVLADDDSWTGRGRSHTEPGSASFARCRTRRGSRARSGLFSGIPRRSGPEGPGPQAHGRRPARAHGHTPAGHAG